MELVGCNEPNIWLEFVPGSENMGADLLSRPITGQGVMDTLRPIPRVHQISVWDGIWEERMKGHWGAHKTYWALQKKGLSASWRMVQNVCRLWKVCAQFQQRKANAPFGQPFFSLEPGHMVFGDVVGPMPMGRGGARYIHCLVNSVTRLGDVMKWRNVSTTSIIKAL